ncbi:glutathione peroxidase [Pseudoalteromonas rubra]|uniref:Glutathione peroxidase n=1 Tax=Pseudoalteromonas rubra TaxID=43658 RepID=A0A0U3IEA4_9GAMM|nr:glutathione peroxidase [Pseudoalteromonas rubra]ALU41740.1 glutathione peroxidase [Pseudoalteromonas rubra]
MSAFYDLTVRDLTGEILPLSSYAGKVVMIVNVASECDYTPQYKQLQKTYDTFKDQGFEVLGVPCNQFWAQEPGDAAQIKSFCEKNYAITFKLTEKVDVNGENQCPLYHFLTNERSPKPGQIDWNFEKFIIDKTGQIVERFAPELDPSDKAIQDKIQAYLA